MCHIVLPTSVYFSILSGIILIVAPHVGAGLSVMCIIAAVIGFTSAVTVPLPGVLLRELVEPHQYATACGWMGVSMGLPNLSNYVLYGKYLTTLSFVMWNVCDVYHRCRDRFRCLWHGTFSQCPIEGVG